MKEQTKKQAQKITGQRKRLSLNALRKTDSTFCINSGLRCGFCLEKRDHDTK